MPKNQQDVNPEPAPSPAQGVTAESPAAPDVNLSAPSPDATMSTKPHEEAIPYSRFKEEIEKNNQLKAELEAMKSQFTEQPPEPFSWESLYPERQTAAPPPPIQQPAQAPVFSPEQIEEKLREDLYQKPFQTLYPIMMEAAKQVIRDQKQQEARVKSIPDFKNYESDYYGVPEDVVLSTQADQELVRYLLAKHRATVTGKQVRNEPSPERFASQPAPPSNGPVKPASSMDDLAERYRKEGEQRVIERLRSQQGLAAESAASMPATSVDDPELDEQGAALMAKLGIPQDKIKSVAKRLDNFVKGR